MLAAAVLAYLLGAVPFSFLIGKLAYGVDIRNVGSGNVGATNLLRACGVKAGVLGLLFDAGKGFAAVEAAGRLSGAGAAGNRLALLAFGCCAVLGHMAPIFLAGRGGGKGVATAAGVFLAIEPAAVGVAASIFGLTVWATRYVSLGSVLAASSMPLILFARERRPSDPVFLLSAGIALAIVWKHRANLARVRAGTESRLGHVDSAAGAGEVDGCGPGRPASPKEPS